MIHMRNSTVRFLLACAGLAILLAALSRQAHLAAGQAPAAGGAYRSPYDVAWSPDGRTLAVSDHTAGLVVLIDTATGKPRAQAAVARPAGLAWLPDSTMVFAADMRSASVVQIAAADGKVVRRLSCGPRPNGVALVPAKGLVLATNTALGDVSAIELNSGREKARIRVLREPFYIAVTQDGSLAVISNLLPAGPASDPGTTAAVSIVDLNMLQKVADIPLPPNASSVRQVAVSPDGRWAYAVHTVGRTTLPATQLERGWVNTNAFSIIDLVSRRHYATVLMDNISQGAADPWGLVLSKDGATAWVTLAGVHQLARIDVAGLHRNLAPAPSAPTTAPAQPAKQRSYAQPTIWQEIKADPSKRAELVNDLSALYVANLITRTTLPGKGPRGISISPDGTRVAVGQYFTGDVLIIDTAETKVRQTIALGPQPAADDVRLGEQIFHDATYAFQQWLSCATCHPNDARVDGLNWDLTNDGIGNPKNAKSLLFSHATAPAMWTGVRDDMETASAAGFRFQAFQPQPEDLRRLQTYLRSLRPEPSPYLMPDGSLSEKARRGKAIFEDARTACVTCHSGEYFTNGKHYDVGTQGPLDHPNHKEFDTPALIELWRTAPYLHDGRAATLQEVFTKFNAGDKHGHTSHLTKEQIDDLVEYLLSL